MKIIPALALLALAPAICGAQDPLAEALRKGIVEEDVNHNPAAAIQNYQSAISRFNEERTAAATALFRMAECYRKLGKAEEASAAYNRIVAEFADQTALANKSRQQLGKPAAPPTPVREVTTVSTEARGRYRATLQAKMEMAYQNLNEVNKKLQLGSAGPSEGTDAAMEYVHAQRELAAFDAGLLGPQAPGAAQSSGARAALLQVRSLLREEIELAQKALAGEQRKYELGTGLTQDLSRRRTACLNLEQELSVLDAMAGQTKTPPKKK